MRFTFYFCVIALGYSILVSCNTIDGIGRDLASGLIHGTRISLMVGRPITATDA